MNSLLLIPTSEQSFEPRAVVEILTTIPSVFGIQGSTEQGRQFTCKYDFNGDSTIARISANADSISFDGCGDASIRLAYEVGMRCGFPTRVIDTAYSFDIEVSTAANWADLRESIRRESERNS